MKACERCGAFGPRMRFVTFVHFSYDAVETPNTLDGGVRSCGRCRERPSRTGPLGFQARRIVAAYWTDEAPAKVAVLLSCHHVDYLNWNIDNLVGRYRTCTSCTRRRLGVA